MCKANLKPEIKQMVISVKTKSISKLLEAAIDAEDCRKELDQKDKSRRTQTPTPSTSKGKKKEEVFNIRLQRLPERRKILRMKPARKEEYERRNQVLLLMKC
ncbi:hypothetical protein MRB53_002087 [Persea americana]|uniref:Uncharacterized protein n=1 Tax=Persea americana TaxID=3435 RepID=A0ACC2MV47_PERAE|nr:hypothetical protein MRB53_002087 [Persea americana]